MNTNEWQRAFFLDERTVAPFIPQRKRDTHKGDYGKSAIVGGSVEYTGAP